MTMGLLDATDDETQNAAISNGLLNFVAMANKKRPFMGLLAGLQGYEQTQASAKDRALRMAMEERKLAMEEQFKQAQIGHYRSQDEQMRATAEKARVLGQMTNGLLNAPGAPSQYGAAGSGINLGGVQETMRPRAGGLAGVSIEDIARLKAAGGTDLLAMWDRATGPGQEVKPGTFYQKDGQREFTPDVQRGLGFSNGRTSVLPGSLEAQAALTGANKTAELSASAPFTLVDSVDAQGVPRKRTLSDVLREQQGGASPQPGPRTPQATGAAFDPMEMALAEAVSSRQPVAYNLGGRSGVLQPGGGPGAGLKTGLGPAEKWVADEKRGLMVNGLGETKPMTGAGGKPIGSPDEAASAKRDNAWATNSEAARTLLKSGPTASGVGTVFDKASSVVGHSPKGSKEADALRGISGWLTINVPRFEGPQSNYDRDLYQQMAANVGDSTLSVERRLFALDTIDRTMTENAKRNPAWRPGDAKGGKSVVRTGTKDGRKWVRYSDGSEGYGD